MKTNFEYKNEKSLDLILLFFNIFFELSVRLFKFIFKYLDKFIKWVIKTLGEEKLKNKKKVSDKKK